MPTLTLLDVPILTFLVGHRVPLLTTVALAIGQAGTTPWLLVLAWLAILIVVVARRAYRRAGMAAIAMIAAVVVARLLKSVIEHPRPPADLTLLAGGGYAFPSTHATWMAAGAVAFVGARLWRSRRVRNATIAALAGFVVFVDFCMIYLGSHWFSDVIVGWVLGAAIGAIVVVFGRDRRPRAPLQTRPTQPAAQAGC